MQGKRTAKIGLGIVTTPERDALFKVAYNSVLKLDNKIDWLQTFVDTDHRGVAVGKNILLKRMMAYGCDYIFLMEDDVEIIDPSVLAMYIAAYRLSKIPHLNFSQHGPNKTTDMYAPQGPVTFWPNACGAFSFYTRHCLEEVGLMDENFVNAYEHVEHSWRIYKGKLSYGLWPDVTGSDKLLRELEDANLKPMTPERLKQVNKAREYWFAKDPACPLIEGII